MSRFSTTAAIALLITIAALSACSGGEDPKPARLIESPQEAVSRVGDITIRANLVRTELLDETMARQYGIARDAETVMLLVSVRRGAQAQESSVAATVTTSVATLYGQPRPVAMRELRSGGPDPQQVFIDYVGTVRVSPPETLRFDLDIAREGGARSTMQFTREFMPQ